jgi:hypothetical protein
MTAMDPYAVLGVRPGSAEAEVVAAYREAAKRWHPDRAGAEGEARMAEINAAYDLVRAATQHGGPAPGAPNVTPATPGGQVAWEGGGGPRRPPGAWLDQAVRHALGRELLEALFPNEDVKLVTPMSTWASPRAILAVTDRRLLWLLDDAVVSRVQSITFRNVAALDVRIKRRNAQLKLRTLAGRRHVFHDLRPHTAETIERHVLGREAA